MQPQKEFDPSGRRRSARQPREIAHRAGIRSNLRANHPGPPALADACGNRGRHREIPAARLKIGRSGKPCTSIVQLSANAEDSTYDCCETVLTMP